MGIGPRDVKSGAAGGCPLLTRTEETLASVSPRLGNLWRGPLSATGAQGTPPGSPLRVSERWRCFSRVGLEAAEDYGGSGAEGEEFEEQEEDYGAREHEGDADDGADEGGGEQGAGEEEAYGQQGEAAGDQHFEAREQAGLFGGSVVRPRSFISGAPAARAY